MIPVLSQNPGPTTLSRLLDSEISLKISEGRGRQRGKGPGRLCGRRRSEGDRGQRERGRRRRGRRRWGQQQRGQFRPRAPAAAAGELDSDTGREKRHSGIEEAPTGLDAAHRYGGSYSLEHISGARTARAIWEKIGFDDM